MTVLQSQEIVTKENIQCSRTARELREFLDHTFDAVRQDKSARENARSRKGLYKRLIEELWPLSLYFEKKYGGSDCRLKLQIGNQGFDALVLDEQGAEIERIEVSWPIDGHKHAETVRLLNERGHGPFEIYKDPCEKLRELFQRTLEGAKKKAVRDYKTVKGRSSLVLVVDPIPYYHPEIYEHRMEVDKLVTELSTINYQVDDVILLFPSSKEVVKVK
jgi:hypothetical protein